MANFLRRNNHLVLLFFVVLLGFWQVSFLVYSLKWDLIDVVFPFRFYFSESIQSGYFPFWNPYLQTGTPFFADLQAPTFYPELLIVSLFTGYSIYTMHFLFVLYIFIAAIGMYQLSFHFNSNKQASLMAAFSYAFCGFIVGHGQHFFLLVGAAWIPFVLKNYLQLLKEGTLVQIVKTAVFVFLMVSGAYQALSFVLFYLLLFLFIGAVLKELVAKNRVKLIQVLKTNFYLTFIVILLLLPLIISTLEVITSVDRLSNGITLEQTIRSGQSWKGIISFLLPLSTLKYGEFFGGIDASMTNHYIGLIPLLFIAVALFHKRTGKEWLFIIFGLIIFASSFQFLPVREFLFNFVPLMNLFKYAAYIRIFGLLALILVGANYLAFLNKNLDKEKKKLLATGIFILLIFTFLIIYALQKTTISELVQLYKGRNLTEVFTEMQFYQHILIQAIFQVVILSGFVLIITYHKKLKLPLRWIVLLVIVELIVAAQLNMSSTVTANDSDPYKMQHDLALCPPNFPLPLDDKIMYNDQTHAIAPPFWRNTYNFTKQVSFGAFSSFELNSFSKLDDDFPNLRKNVLNHHLLYFSDKILPESQFDDKNVDATKDTDVLYLQDEDYSMLSDKMVKTDSVDNISMLEFSPNKITLETTTKNDQFLTMIQTNFKGWKAYIDNSNTPIYTSNFNYRTILLPSGKHIVKFEYKNNKTLVFYVISNLLFFVLVLFLIYFSLQSKNSSLKITALVLGGITLIVVFFLVFRLSFKDKNLTVDQIYEERWAEQDALYSYSEDFEGESFVTDSTFLFEERSSLHVKPENEYTTLVKIANEDLKINSATLVVTVDIYPGNYVEALLVSDISGGNTTDGWHAARTEKSIEKLNSWNKMTYQRNLYDLSEQNEINVYFWNQKKMDFRIDNISVRLYPLIN